MSWWRFIWVQKIVMKALSKWLTLNFSWWPLHFHIVLQEKKSVALSQKSFGAKDSLHRDVWAWQQPKKTSSDFCTNSWVPHKIILKILSSVFGYQLDQYSIGFCGAQVEEESDTYLIIDLDISGDHWNTTGGWRGGSINYRYLVHWYCVKS